MSLSIPKRMQQSPAYHEAPRMERDVARSVGGAVTPASGSREEKGDVRVRSVARLECKATSNKSFSVTREMLDKISEAGEGAGEMPALVVKFLRTKEHPGGSVVVVPEYVLNQLLQTLQT